MVGQEVIRDLWRETFGMAIDRKPNIPLEVVNADGQVLYDSASVLER
jgi:hypothetical protein